MHLEHDPIVIEAPVAAAADLATTLAAGSRSDVGRDQARACNKQLGVLTSEHSTRAPFLRRASSAAGRALCAGPDA